MTADPTTWGLAAFIVVVASYAFAGALPALWRHWTKGGPG